MVSTVIDFDDVKLNIDVLIFCALNHQVHQPGGAALGSARCSAITAGMTCNRQETELADESLLSGELFLLGCGKCLIDFTIVGGKSLLQRFHWRVRLSGSNQIIRAIR